MAGTTEPLGTASPGSKRRPVVSAGTRWAGIVSLAGLCGCGFGVLFAPWSTGVGAAWVQDAGGPDGRSVSLEGPEPPLRLLWRQSVGGPPLGGALLAGPMLLQLTKHPDVIALDLATGTRLGRWRGDDRICGPPALAGVRGELLILSALGDEPGLRAMDRESRQVVWERAGAVCAPVVVRGDTVYAASESGSLSALSVADGRVHWEVSLDGRLLTAPSLAGDTLLVGDAGGGLAAVLVDSGRVLWRRTLDGGVRARPAVDAASGRLWVATASGDLLKVRVADGQTLYTAAVGGLPSTGIALAGGVVAAGSSDQSLYAFDLDTGELAWRLQTGGIVRAAPAGTRTVVYAASGDGVLYAADGTTGALRWKYELDGPVLAPVVLGPDRLTVTTESGSVYLFAGR